MSCFLPLLIAGFAALSACHHADPAAEALHARLVNSLTLPLQLSTAAGPTWQGEVDELEGIAVRATALALNEAPVPYELALLELEPVHPTAAGIVVSQGHFGAGKTDPSAQDIAWRLARRGARVVIMDTPGVEEWDVPGRQIHFAAGAHNRAYLTAAGTNAMALQVAGLRRAVDRLRALGATQIGATGASGGAVQAFYLGKVDPRVRTIVLASAPSIPRELSASGCPCDQLPGLPGPSPALLALPGPPTLWMSELDQPRPPGLAASVDFRVVAGAHAYEEAMQRQAVTFLSRQLPLRHAEWMDTVPNVSLHTPGAAAAAHAPNIPDLKLMTDYTAGRRGWVPAPDPDAPYRLDCKLGPSLTAAPGRTPAVPEPLPEGAPIVLIAGSPPSQLSTISGALRAVGLDSCSLSLPTDRLALAEALGAGRAAADRPAGALLRAAARKKAVGVLAARGWALPASAGTLPYVVWQPLSRIDQVDPDLDPPWIHVPGAWWGAAQTALDGAVATGADLGPLAADLATAVTSRQHPTPPPRQP